MSIRSIHFMALALSSASISPSSTNITAVQQKLHQAITNNSAEEVRQVVVSSAPRGKNEESTEWSFLKAILSNNTEDIKQAVQKVVAEGKNGNTPIMWATLLEKPNAAEILLDCGATIDADIVRYAISTNNTKTALTLVRGGVDISDIIDECMYLCITQYNQIEDTDTMLELMQELINRGYDVNKPWNTGIYKAFDEKAVVLFIQNGARKKQINSRNTLHKAIRRGASNFIMIFINTGTKITLAAKGYRQNRKLTPLLRAIEQGNLDAIKRFLGTGADINQACKVESDTGKTTPLAFAISKNHSQVVKLLLENGARLETETNK